MLGGPIPSIRGEPVTARVRHLGRDGVLLFSDVVLDSDQLLFIVPLLALARWNDGRAVRGAVCLIQLARVLSARGHSVGLG